MLEQHFGTDFLSFSFTGMVDRMGSKTKKRNQEALVLYVDFVFVLIM